MPLTRGADLCNNSCGYGFPLPKFHLFLFPFSLYPPIREFWNESFTRIADKRTIYSKAPGRSGGFDCLQNIVDAQFLIHRCLRRIRLWVHGEVSDCRRIIKRVRGSAGKGGNGRKQGKTQLSPSKPFLLRGNGGTLSDPHPPNSRPVALWQPAVSHLHFSKKIENKSHGFYFRFSGGAIHTAA